MRRSEADSLCNTQYVLGNVLHISLLNFANLRSPTTELYGFSHMLAKPYNHNDMS